MSVFAILCLLTLTGWIILALMFCLCYRTDPWNDLDVEGPP